jgi:hypothetical protein
VINSFKVKLYLDLLLNTLHSRSNSTTEMYLRSVNKLRAVAEAGAEAVFTVNILGVIHLKGLRCIRKVSLPLRAHRWEVVKFRRVQTKNISHSFAQS